MKNHAKLVKKSEERLKEKGFRIKGKEISAPHLRKKVQDWATENGFRLGRAYAELIKKGLKPTGGE